MAQWQVEISARYKVEADTREEAIERAEVLHEETPNGLTEAWQTGE